MLELTLFLRPKDIVMPTRLARVLVAVVGEPTVACLFTAEVVVDAGTCSDVVRRRPRTFDMPSLAESVGEGVDNRFGLVIRSSEILLLVVPFTCLWEEVDDEDGGDATGRSDDRAVVGAAFEDPVVPEDEDPLGNGAIRPPLNDSRVDDVPLAREPGRRGEETLGECAIAVLRVGEGGAGAPRVDGEGVRLRVGLGDPGIVSSGVSAEAWARSLEREEGPAEFEFERVRTGNRCELGDRVGPRGSAAVAFVCDCLSSGRGGLMGRSKGGGLVGLS